MRKLEEKELEKVQWTVSQKDISVVELLAEIYDHYVSHLEKFSAEEFEIELNALEMKFTSKYCKKLEQNLLHTSRKEMFRLAWQQVILLFTWPKALLSLALVLAIIIFWPLLDKNHHMLALITLLGATLVFHSIIWWHSHRKIKIFKNFYKGDNLLISVHISSMMNTIFLPTSIFSLLVTSPKILGFYNIVDTPYFFLISMAFFLILGLLNIGIFQVWKIKSKTALI